MSINITLDGFVYLDNGYLSSSNVKYQAFFYQNGTSSSPSKWNNVRVVEGSGYWNINIGDGDFLTQEGVALSGSKVVVVFWKGSTMVRTSLCSVMEEWGAFEITLSGNSVYTNNVQVKQNIIPNISWTLPSTGFVGVSYDTTNSSNDIHSWLFGSTTMYHWYTRYGQTIYSINKINNSDYDWDDATQTLDLIGAASYTHSWSSSGIYNVQLTVEDECGGTNSSIKQIIIYNSPPVPNIICHQAVSNNISTPNTIVTFEYTGTDPDNSILYIDWYISDSGVYGNTDTDISGALETDIINHTNGIGTDWYGNSGLVGAFTNPGTHNVEIVVHWFDGFSNQTITYSEDFIQLRYTGPVVDFAQAPTNALIGDVVTFDNESTSIGRVGLGLPDHTEYDWTWTDDALIEVHNDNSYMYSLVKVPTTVDCNVKLCANWQDGWDNQVTCVNKDVVFDAKVTIVPVDCYYHINVVGTSNNGTIDSYGWEIYKDTTNSGTGPWDLLWESPVNVNQQSKYISFAEDGYYKAVGYIYGSGTTTSGIKEFYVDVICVSGTVDCSRTVWNGTGVLDVGVDWVHSGVGTETVSSAHSGTNGLDVNMSTGDFIYFDTSLPVDLTDYDLLTMWVKINEWSDDTNISIQFDYEDNILGNALSLNSYLNTSFVDDWQQVYIKLNSFDVYKNYPSSPLVDNLTLSTNGDVSFYIDDIKLDVGTVVYVRLDIEDPSLTSDNVSLSGMTGNVLKPAMNTSDVSIGKPSMDGDENMGLGINSKELKPSMKVENI